MLEKYLKNRIFQCHDGLQFWEKLRVGHVSEIMGQVVLLNVKTPRFIRKNLRFQNYESEVFLDKDFNQHLTFYVKILVLTKNEKFF